jgi:ribosome biogenesis GTPase
MQERLENGLVVRVTGGEVRVRLGEATVACSLRGRLRVRAGSPPVVAGDRVAVVHDGKGGVSLDEVLPRYSWLSRFVEREASERVVVANVDRLFAVASVAEPPLHTAFLDRVLAAAEWGHVTACIVLNKIDLAGSAGDSLTLETLRGCYVPAGYDVVTTCAATGDGVESLASRIGEGVYAFVGESGVGKTSLVNRLDPRLDLRVRSIGEHTGRGRHTTTNAQLFPFRRGYLADTPGMQTFGFPGTDETALAGCFPEFARLDRPCRFHPCTHSHEPDCAVKAALASGEVSASRYQSYLDILAAVRERAKKKPW